METVTLTAPDISCGHCVATVQDAVGRIQGVTEVAADAETKQVAVNFDGAQTDIDAITRALDEAGYPATT